MKMTWVQSVSFPIVWRNIQAFHQENLGKFLIQFCLPILKKHFSGLLTQHNICLHPLINWFQTLQKMGFKDLKILRNLSTNFILGVTTNSNSWVGKECILIATLTAWKSLTNPYPQKRPFIMILRMKNFQTKIFVMWRLFGVNLICLIWESYITCK